MNDHEVEVGYTPSIAWWVLRKYQSHTYERAPYTIIPRSWLRHRRRCAFGGMDDVHEELYDMHAQEIRMNPGYRLEQWLLCNEDIAKRWPGEEYRYCSPWYVEPLLDRMGLDTVIMELRKVQRIDLDAMLAAVQAAHRLEGYIPPLPERRKRRRAMERQMAKPERRKRTYLART